MDAIFKQEVLDTLNANSTAKWLLHEIQNLKRAFPEPFEVEMPRLKNQARHSMEDTLDNLYSVFFDILGQEWDEDTTYQVYDFIDTSVEIEIDGVTLTAKEA